MVPFGCGRTGGAAGVFGRVGRGGFLPAKGRTARIGPCAGIEAVGRPGTDPYPTTTTTPGQLGPGPEAKDSNR